MIMNVKLCLSYYVPLKWDFIAFKVDLCNYLDKTLISVTNILMTLQVPVKVLCYIIIVISYFM